MSMIPFLFNSNFTPWCSLGLAVWSTCCSYREPRFGSHTHGIQHFLLDFVGTRHAHSTHTCRQNSHTHKIKTNIFKEQQNQYGVHRLCMVLHAYNPNSEKPGAGKPPVPRHFRLHNELITTQLYFKTLSLNEWMNG